jgi:hypothetical protein
VLHPERYHRVTQPIRQRTALSLIGDFVVGVSQTVDSVLLGMVPCYHPAGITIS